MAHSDVSMISTFHSSPTSTDQDHPFYHHNDATTINSSPTSSSSLSTSPPSQRTLNVASISGAAEANALDQAVGIHQCNNTSLTPKTARLKRPPNAYLLFNREMRRKLLDQNEHLTVALISKLISESWRNLPQVSI
ncbi:uncharacterized protein BX664DRAFT_78564 [Halteromyces radiatus]|uniref:uncharacterized protein n=1 Tax=Halteromyces radiatus TaxID=101107 RepID=UPI0022204587|nr:uncharacterized protein BX664DRAFT_78564 [Halteromyces radiatus]KAI8097356.1 hypothetical protein BX664DRAFT_78564 [Halteromyces radiatus]